MIWIIIYLFVNNYLVASELPSIIKFIIDLSVYSLVPIIIIVSRFYSNDFGIKDWNIKKLNRKGYLSILLYALLYIYMSNSLLGIIRLFFPKNYNLEDIQVAPSGIVNQIIFITILIVIAPIIEEVIFRGVIFNRLKITLSVNFSMILMSLSFALLHKDIIAAFIFSIFACIIYKKYNDLRASIFFRFLINLLVAINLLRSSAADIADNLTSTELIPSLIIFMVSTSIFIRFHHNNKRYLYN